jgi:hypothetical protein
MPGRRRRALWVVPTAIAAAILLIGAASAFCHFGYFPWAGFGISLDRGQFKAVYYDASDRHTGEMSTTIQGWSIWRERPPNLDLYAMWPGVMLHTRGPRYAAEIAPWVPAAPLLLIAVWGFRLDRRWRNPSRCPRCGYSRAGLAAAAPCPECGSEAPQAAT